MKEIDPFRWIEILGDDFKTTGSPLSPWFAIQACTFHGIPFPPWVKKYLSSVADHLLQIKKPGKNAGTLVCRALGIENARIFSDSEREMGKLIIYLEIEIMAEELGKKTNEEGAFAIIAGKKNLSTERIRDIYYEMKNKHFISGKPEEPFRSLGDSPCVDDE